MRCWAWLAAGALHRCPGSHGGETKEEREARSIVRVEEGYADEGDEDVDDREGNYNSGGIKGDKDGGSRPRGRADRAKRHFKFMTGEMIDSVKMGVYEVLRARRDAYQYIFGELVDDAAKTVRS